MKKATSIILSTSILLSLCSCEEKSDSYKIKTKGSNMISGLSNSYENGVIYLSDDVCNFYDYPSDTSIPLCMKPNCTHEDKDCISKIIASSAGGVDHSVIYNDCIYYFTETESIEGEDKGKESTYNIESILHKCDLKSGEVTDIINIDDLDCTSSVNMFFSEDTIYFIASNGAYQFEDGTWMNAGTDKQYLCSVNLSDNNFENYGLVNDNEYVSNNVVITENSIYATGGQVFVLGVYDNKLYLCYQYVTDKNIVIDAIENDDTSNIDWEFEVKTFDLDTKELSLSDKEQPICLNDDWYVTENKSDKKIIAENKDDTTVEFDSNNDFVFDPYQYSIYNEKIFDLYKGYIYDLSTQQISQTSDDLLGNNVVDYISDENKYVLYTSDSNGNPVYLKVDENTLIKDN